MFEMQHLETRELVVDVVLLLLEEHMLGKTLDIVRASRLLASVAAVASLEVVVAALAALPATWWEDHVCYLWFGFLFVAHHFIASVATLSSFEVVVTAGVAVPSSVWDFEVLLVSWRTELCLGSELLSMLVQRLLIVEVGSLADQVAWQVELFETHATLLWGTDVVVRRKLVGLRLEGCNVYHVILSWHTLLKRRGEDAVFKYFFLGSVVGAEVCGVDSE